VRAKSDASLIPDTPAKSDSSFISDVPSEEKILKTKSSAPLFISDVPSADKNEVRKLFKAEDEPKDEPKIFRKYKEEKSFSSRYDNGNQMSGDTIITPHSYDQDGSFTMMNGAVKDSGVQYINVVPEWQN